jgi:hypothetical protein
MPKRSEIVRRWVLVNNQGQYSRNEGYGDFTPDLEEAFVYVSRPQKTVAVRPVEVTVSLVKGHE